MKGFRSVGGAQKSLASFSRISPHFRPRRHLHTAPGYGAEMTERHTTWRTTTGAGPMSAAACIRHTSTIGYPTSPTSQVT